MTISDEDIKRLDDRYVSKTECEAKNDKVQQDISTMSKEMSSMCAKMAVTNKILAIIATAVISGIVGLIITVITKVLGG